MGDKRRNSKYRHKKNFNKITKKNNKPCENSTKDYEISNECYNVKKLLPGIKLVLCKNSLKKARKILNRKTTYRCIKTKNNNITIVKAPRNKISGSRLFNLQYLQEHLLEVTSHVAMCSKCTENVKEGGDAIEFISEQRNGLSVVVKVKCLGCHKRFILKNSDNINNLKDINVRAVWGSMVTGGGFATLNECLGTMGVPTVSPSTYTSIETDIGKWWKGELDLQMKAAAEEEKALAVEEGSYFQEVPAITVICDGGWSKRSHKHSYDSMSGVAVIFGAATKKLLHIGVRNKHCPTCENKEEEVDHECYMNWGGSAQAMEADIIVEGFLECEERYGVRYMKVIADGDSSVYAAILNTVPIWGPHVQKLECANHATKCLRSNLEKLVTEKPRYKGKGKLTKLNMKRITTGVRCAIKMRTDEGDRKMAISKLRCDIRNAGRHVMGFHDKCSTDFCLNKSKDTGKDDEDDEDVDVDEGDEDDSVLISHALYWSESVNPVSEDTIQSIRTGSRNKSYNDETMNELLKDLSLLLNRMADKADRLVGNFTSNLAESYMHIRSKFDGGKVINRNNKGSFHARCYGAALRSLLGPAWSPSVYLAVTKTRADPVFIETYRKRSLKYSTTKRASKKASNKLKRRLKKANKVKANATKKARTSYGPEVLLDTPDIDKQSLKAECEEWYEKEVKVDKSRIKKIEIETREQSLNEQWRAERKKRLTSSVFGEVVCRSPVNNRPALVKRLLYTTFKGNSYTVKGLSEEQNAKIEYLNKNKDAVKVETPGLMIDDCNPHLAASADAIVFGRDGPIGLLEIKTLLQSNTMLIEYAAKNDKTFCLTVNNGKLQLKRNHKFFYQVQGQLNVLKFDWCDFMIRRVNPNDVYIERIWRDTNLWRHKMLPKLNSFYETHMLPELASPRNGTITGIRKPAIPWFDEKSTAAVSTRPKKRKTNESIDNEPIITGISPKTPTTDNESVATGVRTYTTTSPTEEPRVKRTRITKFVGRKVNHRWLEADGTEKWYSGQVLSVKSGTDGAHNAVYEVYYEDDKESYDVDSLHADYLEGSLKFTDI